MDDILHKNIFNDKDLQKLSPDYCHSDIHLRMQVRRTMFKDIHNHSFLKNANWHRKSNKRMKDGYKINKEIVKMRNDFKNTNLRNQIIMKSDLKNIIPRSEFSSYDGDYGELLLSDIKVFNDDTDKCIQDLQDDIAALVLCNDREFKLNTKEKPEKYIVKNQTKKNISVSKADNSEDEIEIEHSIRIDCTYEIKTPDVTEDDITQEKIITSVTYSDECEFRTENELQPSVRNDDLQTLLIMMAISKSNNQDELQNPSPTLRNEHITHTDEAYYSFLLNSERGDVTESLHIIPIRIEMNKRQNYLVKKYTVKWRKYIAKKKEYIDKQRQETLSKFFDKLSKKKMNSSQSPEFMKAKSLARDYNTYHHRYQVQKHIIALQKAKLEEQNRVIEELKYNKIIEASRESVDAMKEEVRKTYFEIDRQLKPKIKCLTNELKLNEIEEPSLVLQCLKVPKFLQRMEKRAREREEKHAMIRERRIQMEEERIRLKQQAELAKAEMDKEEKLKRIKDLREKRRKEKIENIRKKQHVERLRALIVMADLHYERTLMIQYGIRPFKKLLKIKRDNMLKAKLHYAFQLKKNVFLHWMWYTEDMWFERHFMAEDFNRKKILRKCFNALKKNVNSYTLKKQVADDYYDLYVMQLAFRKLRAAIEMIRKENEMKWQMSVIYYNRTLPALNALKREQDARKSRWREKVLLVVPDYAPPDD